MTRNGRGRELSGPIVTWRSCMTSSRADWTLAGARLISSASRKLANTGPELGVERVVGPVDAGADEVGRDEVRGELDALERRLEDVGEGLDRERLGEAGDALEQEVAAREERDEDPLEHLVLADDDPADLVEDGLAGQSPVANDFRSWGRGQGVRGGWAAGWAGSVRLRVAGVLLRRLLRAGCAPVVEGSRVESVIENLRRPWARASSCGGCVSVLAQASPSVLWAGRDPRSPP